MNKPAQSVDAHSVMFITPRPEVVMVEGKGSWLTDNNGKRYLDFLQGWAVNCLGHGNPGMIAPVDRRVEGFHARVVQHECDHLDGILYPRRIRDLTRFGFTDVLFPGQFTPDEG